VDEEEKRRRRRDAVRRYRERVRQDPARNAEFLERARLSSRAYWLSNRERILAARRAYVERNRELVYAQNRAYAQKNRAKSVLNNMPRTCEALKQIGPGIANASAQATRRTRNATLTT
jgi:hypothetical protein